MGIVLLILYYIVFPSYLFVIRMRETAKKSFFSGPVTKRGEGKGQATMKKIPFFLGGALVAGPLKKELILRLPL